LLSSLRQFKHGKAGRIRHCKGVTSCSVQHTGESQEDPQSFDPGAFFPWWFSMVMLKAFWGPAHVPLPWTGCRDVGLPEQQHVWGDLLQHVRRLLVLPGHLHHPGPLRPHPRRPERERQPRLVPGGLLHLCKPALTAHTHFSSPRLLPGAGARCRSCLPSSMCLPVPPAWSVLGTSPVPSFLLVCARIHSIFTSVRSLSMWVVLWG
jgi:hypothetical protein